MILLAIWVALNGL